MAEEPKKGIPLEYEDMILGLIKLEKKGIIKRAELEEKLIPAVKKVQESFN